MEPTELASARAVPFRLMGAMTVAYAVLASSCVGLALTFGGFTGETPLATSLLWASSAMYTLGFVPGIAGVVGARVAPLLHALWALPLLVVETLSLAVFLRDSPGPHVAGVACDVIGFMVWPAVCFVVSAATLLRRT
jgi:hypothetical protein